MLKLHFAPNSRAGRIVWLLEELGLEYEIPALPALRVDRTPLLGRSPKNGGHTPYPPECHVINTSSMAGVTTLPFTSIYHMSKHAVLAYSESLYHELNMREAKIGVSALCPEAIATAIGRSERNRPSKLSEDGPVSTESKIVNQALKDTVDNGVKPEVIADRVLEAVRENRFYILSEDVWRDAAHTRLDDVRLARNPTFTPPLS